MNIYSIFLLISLLIWIDDVFYIQIVYNLAELIILILGIPIFLKKKWPHFIKFIAFYFIINSIIFALNSPYFHWQSIFLNFRILFLQVLLFFIGIGYSRYANDTKLINFFKLLMIVSIPLSLIGNIIYIGDAFTPQDTFGGIYGVQGGSGTLGMLLSIIIVVMLSQRFVFQKTSNYFGYLILYIILTSYAESKIAYFLFPLLSLMVLIVYRTNILKKIRIILLIVFTLMSFQLIFNSVIWTKEEHLINPLSIDYAKNKFNVDEIMKSDHQFAVLSNVFNIENYRLNRTGGIVFSIAAISRDPITLLFGYGPGTAQNSNRYNSAIMQMGMENLKLHYLGGATLLFEHGIIGLIGWLLFYLYLFIIFSKIIVNSFKGRVIFSNIILFLYLFIPVLTISLFYNWSYLKMNFGGLFMLLLGAIWKKLESDRAIC